MLERLNKILASAGVASRRQIDTMIASGHIKVNGQPAQLGQKIDPQTDKVSVNRQILDLASKPGAFEYWLVNKPRGVISTAKDSHGRDEVVGMVKSQARLYPVGRLDSDSEGLILLTNDGDLAYRLTHPKFEVPKTYEVTLVQTIGDTQLQEMERGIRLDGRSTAPAQIKRLGDKSFAITITEGRKRQIRRMCGVLGFGVARLVRVCLAGLKLGALKSGQSRVLTEEEVETLIAR